MKSYLRNPALKSNFRNYSNKVNKILLNEGLTRQYCSVLKEFACWLKVLGKKQTDQASNRGPFWWISWVMFTPWGLRNNQIITEKRNSAFVWGLLGRSVYCKTVVRNSPTEVIWITVKGVGFQVTVEFDICFLMVYSHICKECWLFWAMMWDRRSTVTGAEGKGNF